MYQVLTQGCKFSHFCNFASRFPRFPVTLTRIGRRLMSAHHSDFASAYGIVSGWGAPSEGSHIWNRWMASNGYLDETALSLQQRSEVYATVAGIEHAMTAPFLNKVVEHSVHIRLLDAIFPESLFIMMLRRPEFTIQSLLLYRERGRRLDGTSLNEWRSVRPRQYDVIKEKDYVDQVCEQVYYVECNAYEDMCRVGISRCLPVDYALLCAEPGRVVDEVRRFEAQHGVCVEPRHCLPEQFPASEAIRLPAEIWTRVEGRVAELWGADDPWRKPKETVPAP